MRLLKAKSALIINEKNTVFQLFCVFECVFDNLDENIAKSEWFCLLLKAIKELIEKSEVLIGTYIKRIFLRLVVSA